jgi:hypothetical protein
MRFEIGKIVNLPYVPKTPARITNIRQDSNGVSLIDLVDGEGKSFLARECELTELTTAQRQFRINIRNFLLVATIEELQGVRDCPGIEISDRTNDHFRVLCIQELLEQAVREKAW